MNWFTQIPPRRLRAILASAIGVSAVALLWIGYRAVGEWQHAAGLVASRRAAAAVELLVSALSHDMRGAHTTVQVGAERDDLAAGSTADLLHPIAGAFTRACEPFPNIVAGLLHKLPGVYFTIGSHIGNIPLLV